MPVEALVENCRGQDGAGPRRTSERDWEHFEATVGILDASARGVRELSCSRLLECGGVQRWTGCARAAVSTAQEELSDDALRYRRRTALSMETRRGE